VLKFSGVPLLIEFAIYIDQDLKLLIVGADLEFVIGARRAQVWQWCRRITNDVTVVDLGVTYFGLISRVVTSGHNQGTLCKAVATRVASPSSPSAGIPEAGSEAKPPPADCACVNGDGGVFGSIFSF
jgi:hypothetical protein